MVVVDAGGNNSRMFKYLRKGRDLGDKGWLEEDMVSFENPFDPSRRVAMAHCSTHNQKSSRNSLYRSHPSRTKAFILHGVAFGWNQIVAALKRDQDRDIKDTDLNDRSVSPDRWDLMNASLSKKPFTYNTITEIMVHLAVSDPFNCFDEIRDVPPEHKQHVHDIYKYRIKVLKDHAAGASLEQKMELNVLEYCAAVGVIFNEFFMNKFERLTLDNINEHEERMKECLSFFEKWRDEQIQLRQRKVADWKETFLAHETYKNLRIGVAGFFQYARYVLAEPNAPAYIPMLHSNTSSLEAFFSQVRGMRRDSPASKWTVRPLSPTSPTSAGHLFARSQIAYVERIGSINFK